MHPSLIILHSARDDPSGGRCPAQILQLDTSQASKESHNSIHNRKKNASDLKVKPLPHSDVLIRSLRH